MGVLFSFDYSTHIKRHCSDGDVLVNDMHDAAAGNGTSASLTKHPVVETRLFESVALRHIPSIAQACKLTQVIPEVVINKR